MSAEPSLAARLGYTFRDPTRLTEALTHPSHRHEHPGERDNAQLEFLGDAVLRLGVAEILLRAHPDSSEGRLTAWTHHLVRGSALAEVGERLGLERDLRLGAGEAKNVGGRARRLEDAVEAVLGAIDLDGGLAPALERIRWWLRDELVDEPKSATEDPKGRLQDHFQKQGLGLPLYVEHPADPGVHHVTCHSPDEQWLAEGRGRSRKEAQKAAARAALLALGLP